MALSFVKVEDYKKFGIVAIQSDEGNNLYYFGQHSCDNSINTKKRKTVEYCKGEIDRFWDKYGVCPDLNELMQKAMRSGKVKIDSKCSTETIKSWSKGLQ